jgi:hypothetical protein
MLQGGGVMSIGKEKLSETELQLKSMVDSYAEDVINGKMKFYPENDDDYYEAYSVKYIVDQSGNLEDVMVMLAGGGPTVWLDTNAKEVQGFWGGDKYTKYIYDYEYIIDYFDELYSCLK